MTEVALAAGFGSVRRFNETFQQLYRPPAGAAAPLPAGQAGAARRSPLKLPPYAPPYDWDAILAFLRSARHPGCRVVADGALRARHRDRRRLAAACSAPGRR